MYSHCNWWAPSWWRFAAAVVDWPAQLRWNSASDLAVGPIKAERTATEGSEGLVYLSRG